MYYFYSMIPTLEQISKIMVDSKYRLPLIKQDVAVYVVDIPKAAAQILEIIKQNDL